MSLPSPNTYHTKMHPPLKDPSRTSEREMRYPRPYAELAYLIQISGLARSLPPQAYPPLHLTKPWCSCAFHSTPPPLFSQSQMVLRGTRELHITPSGCVGPIVCQICEGRKRLQSISAAAPSPGISSRPLQRRRMLQDQGVRAEALITAPANLASEVTDAIRSSVSGGSLAEALQQQGELLVCVSYWIRDALHVMDTE